MLETNKPPEPSSPKKRKATGPQQAAPAPTSQPQYTPPSFSQAGSSVSNTPLSRRRGHSRQRSDLGSRSSDPYGRPLSRQRHRHTESSFSMSSPVREEQPAERQRPRGGSHPVSVSSILEYGDSRAQPQPPLRQPQHDPRYSAGPEMRHEERRTPPDEHSRRGSAVRRDDVRD
jgi:hypothetical protein